jgi:hypothetical protein
MFFCLQFTKIFKSECILFEIRTSIKLINYTTRVLGELTVYQAITKSIRILCNHKAHSVFKWARHWTSEIHSTSSQFTRISNMYKEVTFLLVSCFILRTQTWKFSLHTFPSMYRDHCCSHETRLLTTEFLGATGILILSIILIARLYFNFGDIFSL